jgi:predicted unusual protein kinase regulating ubiquinone biosynthesis (AarF/ABC1/UbiB family)
MAFHADPHPGNLFVMPLPAPADADGQPGQERPWQLTFVDFGMVGRIPAETRVGMRELIIGIGTRDAARVVKAYQMLGVLLPGADLAMIEKAGSDLFDRFWGKSMSELQQVDMQEMKEFARQFGELIYNLPFQVPQDIIFLARAVGILSGMCTGLDPNFNVWEHLAPYSGKLLAEEAEAGPETWLKELGGLAHKLITLPNRTDAMLGKMERGEFVVRDPQLTEQVRRLEKAVLRAAGGVIFAALLIGGIQLYLSGQASLSSVLWGGAALTLLWVVFPRRK